jgi:hypothetical protein
MALSRDTSAEIEQEESELAGIRTYKQFMGKH